MRTSCQNGFTLVELMITLLISGIIVAAIYSAYITQQRTYTIQEQIAEMQQNIRAALMIMTSEIRMAGYDPDDLGVAGVTVATTAGVTFTLVADDDGIDNNNIAGTDEPGELKSIQYDLYDAYGDGDNDIGRQVGGANKRALAENIEAIEFNYILADGTSTTDATVSGDLNNIRSIQISILARASQPDSKFTNTMTYTPASGTPWDLNGAAAGNAANDNFRRRLLITTVNCRNMGL